MPGRRIRRERCSARKRPAPSVTADSGENGRLGRRSAHRPTRRRQPTISNEELHMALPAHEETFEGTGGLKIFFRSWRPTGNPRGHGTADKATVPAGSQLFYDTTGSKDK